MRTGAGIWRALEQARAMNLAADGERPARLGGDGISRRRVLAALGGGLAATALPRFPAFAQAHPRVVIVGGGLAGLSALDTLAARGVPATLYEARAATGGRTRSVRGVFASEFAFDEGAQLINTDQADMLRLVRRFRLRLVDRRGFGPFHEIQIGRNGRAVGEVALARALRGIAARITADSDRLDADYEAVAREIDALSVRDYLDRHGLRPGEARDALEAGIRTEYGAEPHEASALELLFNLPTVDGARLTRISLSDERYLISGGTAQVAAALSRQHEGSIRLSKRLTGLEIGGDSVRLAFADGEEVRADRAIFALPASLLRDLRIEGPLPPLWRALIDEVQLGRNEKVIVGYDRPAWRGRMGFGGALWSAGDFSAVWDAVSLAPAPGPGALCYFLGGDQVDAARGATMAELAARFSASARRVVPSLPAPNGIHRRTRWCEDPLTRGAYVNYRPGQLSRFASLMTVEEDGEVRASGAGPVQFAGEWLSDAFPGYMNGAVQTGRLAAEATLALARAAAA
ncbi:MAG: flavin monoamine oxidase family protein [Sphingosinicella sp.]|uniref:flavin monoamine oxidase family protein n=1 Tax=Sphingosinicella sp. TaxID=1917971 RepID=UPI0040380401